MPLYCIRVAYTPERVGESVRRPQDRLLTVRADAEKLGGRAIGDWIQLADYDVMITIEMAGIIDAAAMSLAFYAGAQSRTSRRLPSLQSRRRCSRPRRQRRPATLLRPSDRLQDARVSYYSLALPQLGQKRTPGAR